MHILSLRTHARTYMHTNKSTGITPIILKINRYGQGPRMFHMILVESWIKFLKKLKYIIKIIKNYTAPIFYWYQADILDEKNIKRNYDVNWI